MATPSVAMIPSGYKDGTLYNVLPNNATGDFDVTRGSLATRVNKLGLIEPVGTLGADVVLNGDFEQLGADQVLNGDFAQEGVEQVTNGDFATDTDWTKGTGWTIGSGTANFDTSSNESITQESAFVDGKTYKVTLEVKSYVRGVPFILISSGTPVNIPRSVGVHTLYVVAGTNVTKSLRIYGGEFGSGGEGSIDNVSVVEVGQDWFLNSKWSIVDNAVRLVSADTAASTLSQDNVFTIGKNYKITLDAEVVSGIAKISGSGGLGFLNIDQTKSYSIYWVADATTLVFNRVSTISDITITNITIEEVGQDWVFNGAVSVTAQGARITSDGTYSDLTQNNALVLGDTYEMEYEITESVIGGLSITGSFGTGIVLKNTVGVHKFYAVATTTTLQIKRSGVTDVTIDNIIVKRLNGDDTPRIDYTDGGCPVLLTEPQSTNLLTQSNDFINTSWVKSNATVVEGFVSPDGSSNATKLVEDSINGIHRLRDAIVMTADTDYSLSVFAKKGTLSNIQLALLNTLDSQVSSRVFDLENGVLGEEIVSSLGTLQDSKIEDFGNGWYRCTIVGQIATAPNNFQVTLAPLSSGNTTTGNQVSYNGDGLGDVQVYGAQLEELSYATSYIPTYGSVRTRLQDNVKGAGTVTDFNDSEGVLFIEINGTQVYDSSRYISISSGGTSNRVTVGYVANSSTISVFVSSGGATQGNMAFAVNIADNHKIAVKYKLNDFALWIDGTEVATDISGVTPSSLSQLAYGNGSPNSDNFFGKTSQIQVFNTALSDHELELLTTDNVDYASYATMASFLNYNIS